MQCNVTNRGTDTALWHTWIQFFMYCHFFWELTQLHSVFSCGGFVSRFKVGVTWWHHDGVSMMWQTYFANHHRSLSRHMDSMWLNHTLTNPLMGISFIRYRQSNLHEQKIHPKFLLLFVHLGGEWYWHWFWCIFGNLSFDPFAPVSYFPHPLAPGCKLVLVAQNGCKSNLSRLLMGCNDSQYCTIRTAGA